jgi:hypothetical protein
VVFGWVLMGFGWLNQKLVTFSYFLLFFVFGGCYGAVCWAGFSGWQGYYS